MKRFEFRLQRLQKLRERIREQRRVAHAQAVDYERRVERQIEELRQTRSDQMDVLHELLSQDRIRVEDAIQSRVYDGALDGVAQNLDRQLGQIQHVVAARRGALVASERDVRMLEKLEEKLRARHQHAVDRAERESMDEFANGAVHRKGDALDESS